MDRRFLNCLAICLMTAGVAVAAPYGQSARPAVYQAEEEVEAPSADGDGYGYGGQGDGSDGYDDGGGAYCGDDCGGGCCNGGCGGGCGGCCNLSDDFNGCCELHGFWAGGEYLGWWFKGQKLPTLVTTSPTGTSQAQAGLPPNFSVVIGDTTANDGMRSGARINAGYWYDDCHSLGWQGNVFGFGESVSNYSASGNGSPILARPFFNTQTSSLASGLISFPDVVSGDINVRTTSQVMGAELNIRKMLQNNCCYRLEMIGGYRYFYLNESLKIHESTTSTATSSPIPVGTMLDIQDGFGGRNTFNGGQLGLQLGYTNCRWSCDVLAKVAVGSMDQIVNIAGSTTVTVPGQAAVTNPGGFLALGSNSGNFERTRFSAIPELNLNLGYQLNNCWRINAGYMFMYVANVVRPAEQTDSFINPNEFPPTTGGGGLPRFIFRDNDMWVQGFNLGMECRF